MNLKQLIDFKILSFNRICEMIANGEHFSLARYGDGEFNAILGKDGANCDGHEYFPEMGADLAATLASNPPYFIGLHQSARIQEETLQWLRDNKMIGRKYVANAVFHDAVRDGKMGKFWEACKGKDVITVGPEYTRKQSQVTTVLHVRIPGRNTYEDIEGIADKMSEIDFENTIVLICASMCAPLIVDHCYKGKYGKSATFIDFGSSFDPYVGVKSRSFHKNITNG